MMKMPDFDKPIKDLTIGDIFAWCFWLTIASFVLMWIAGYFVPTDSTDLNWHTRSGADLVTDYGTGVQYLKTAEGSLIPRLDRDGHVMVTKGNAP